MADKNKRTLSWKSRLQRQEFQRVSLGLILSTIAFLLYANTLHHGFVLDDTPAITENHLVQQGIKGIPELLKTDYHAGSQTAQGILYRPLSLIMFAIEWELFPNNPFPGHLINVLLYALTVYWAFTLLFRLMAGTSPIVPFLITLLFTVHPIHTEVIANIKSRDEILSFLFALAALHLTLTYLDDENIRFLIAAAACYFLSLMSKESSITIFAVVPVMLYFFTDKPLKKVLAISGGLASGAALYLILRGIVFREVSGVAEAALIDNFMVGAKDFGSRTATAVAILGKYLGLLFFPQPLSSDYAYNQIPIVEWANYGPLLSLALYVILVVVALVRFRKKELWVFGIIFYLITMSLYTNIVITIGSGFGERFLYVPSLGFCITIVPLLTKLLKPTGGFAKSLVTIIILLSVAGSLKTISRNSAWKSQYTLYSSDIKNAPNNARLHYWYANETMRARTMTARIEEEKLESLDLAISEYNKALEIYPDYADAFAQRGLAYSRRGDKQKAETDYKRAIDLKANRWEVFNNLGVVYGEQNNLPEALKYFQLALQRESRFPDPYKNIGSVYFLWGDCDKAIEQYLEAIKHATAGDKEVVVDAYNHLSLCYGRKGDAANEQKYAALAQQNAAAR